MTAPPLLEQALFHRPDRQRPELRARSAGFRAEWVPEAEQMALDFGDRPSGLPCPPAVFAHPLTVEHVAVVRVADVPGRTGVLALHFLIVARNLYERFLGDPFELAAQVPPVVDAAGELPALPCPPPLPRTVERVRMILSRVKAGALREGEDPEAPDFRRTVANAESPALLGGVQVLVDGGRLIFERPAGDLDLLAGLWALLPDGTRGRRWPASFAFSNRLEFDALAVPGFDPEDYPGYTTEEQAADYPPGSYELALQLAAEAGDQAALDRCFARHDSGEVLRRTLTLLAAVLLIVLGGALLRPPPPSAPEERAERRDQAAVAAGIAAAADPWSALGLYQYGKLRWGQPP